MNLLNNIFSEDDSKIRESNKWSIIISLVFLFVIGIILMIKKDHYYTNSYSVTDNSFLLVVEKEMVNEIQNSKEIILNDIKSNYSINSITLVSNYYLINISLKTEVKNISNGEYKVYLGKERLFDYIVRIIKN